MHPWDLVIIGSPPAVRALLHFEELDEEDAPVTQNDLPRGAVRQHLDAVLLGDLELLGARADLVERPPEAQDHALGAAPEGAAGAVHGRVPGPEHHDGAVQRRQGRRGGPFAAHPGLGGLGHLRQ